jgi:formylglycine-generating enzyme required for sulfatase activity/tRNA A-37 threonylcarbamoyl transferase component Bud32
VVGRDFRVVKHLASGAMGAVYIVDQLSTGKQRAMKVMSPELAENDRARERFVLEARVGGKVESDHVVEVVTAGIDEASGTPYLVMELLKGEELSDLVMRTGPLPLGHVAEILKQAGHALAQAHALGIVHRDIKPENLFIAESRREGVPFTVKILDFGIAKLIAERTAAGTQPIGTPLFMAPEQTDRQGNISPACDVWPLGVMAFYLLTGQFYWRGHNAGITQLLREVIMEPLAPASARAAELGRGHLIPAGFDAWFAHCVTRDLSQRYPNAGDAVRGFQALIMGNTSTGLVAPHVGGSGTVAAAPLAAAAATAGSTGISSSVTAPQAGSKSSVGLIAGGFALLLVVGGGVVFALNSGGEESGTTQASAAPPVTATASATASAVAATSGCPEDMVLIEGGNMFMGSADTDLGDDVRPPHKVKVSTFCLDKREVTAGAYKACTKSGDCLRAHASVQFPRLKPKDAAAYSKLCNVGNEEHIEHPINCVDWQMAAAYCSGEGGRVKEGGARLPSEAEWEFAARGSGQRTYPWGDEEPGPKLLNACGSECEGWHKKVGLTFYGVMFEGDDGNMATAKVGSYPDGASSGGVLDLAGNVWEWTADWYAPYGKDAEADPKGPDSGEQRVVRGGGFVGMKPTWAKPAYRWKTAPDTRSHGIGFRCAATPK